MSGLEPPPERHAPLDLRRFVRKLVLGDWHPLLRDPLDLIRLSFLAAAVGFALARSGEYAVRMALTFLLLLMAANLRIPRPFDLLFIIGMALQAWGNALRLFERIDWWDNLVHLAIPVSATPVLYILLLRLQLVRDIASEQHPLHRFGIVVFATTSGLSVATIYEIYEYLAVRWLHADLAIGYTDTINDLLLGVVGTQGGGALLMLWSYKRWRTERTPGL